jgi:hypothetical protein
MKNEGNTCCLLHTVSAKKKKEKSNTAMTTVYTGLHTYTDSRQGDKTFPPRRVHTGCGMHAAPYRTGSFRGRNLSDCEAHRHTLPRLRKRGATPPLPHTSSWRCA